MRLVDPVPAGEPDRSELPALPAMSTATAWRPARPLSRVRAGRLLGTASPSSSQPTAPVPVGAAGSDRPVAEALAGSLALMDKVLAPRRAVLAEAGWLPGADPDEPDERGGRCGRCGRCGRDGRGAASARWVCCATLADRQVLADAVGRLAAHQGGGREVAAAHLIAWYAANVAGPAIAAVMISRRLPDLRPRTMWLRRARAEDRPAATGGDDAGATRCGVRGRRGRNDPDPDGPAVARTTTGQRGGPNASARPISGALPAATSPAGQRPDGPRAAGRHDHRLHA
ncbi:MAG: hypothetical protein IRZ08_14055, partial [Frankia sp.]|nr:hypothetical protein [Frankia sp.]